MTVSISQFLESSGPLGAVYITSHPCARNPPRAAAHPDIPARRSGGTHTGGATRHKVKPQKRPSPSRLLALPTKLILEKGSLGPAALLGGLLTYTH